MNRLRSTTNQQLQIKPQSITVKPVAHYSSREFLKKLDFEYVDEVYFQKHKSELDFHVYEFEVTHGSSSWTIRRTVKECQNLEKSIKNDAFYYFRQKEINTESSYENQDKILTIVADFIQRSLNATTDAQINSSLLRFLEISYISFGTNVKKYKECFLLKKAGGRYGESKCARCGTFWAKWDKRYLIITSEGVLYSKGPELSNCQIREVINFDYNFTINHGEKETGEKNCIIIECTARRLVLKASNQRQYFDFLYCLQEGIKQSPYTKQHRFCSFAPIREATCKWYIDGQGYFQDVYEALIRAKTTVYITDWWLSPEFYLKRPVGSGDDLTNRDSRLDRVLKRVADNGVLVFAIVYQEPRIALNNDSLHTKTYLESLSSNIKVLRHPSQKIPFLYSHHEKMVVIDGKIGFMGGLDICFGRMDTQQHNLFDIDDGKEFWPGMDFSNSRVKDFYNVKQNVETCLLPDKHECPKMPWHDIAMKCVGDVVIDMVRHFVQYWNFVTIGQEFQNRKNNQLLHNQTQEEIGMMQRTLYLSESNDDYRLMQDPEVSNSKQIQQKERVKQPTRSDSLIKNDLGFFDDYVQQIEEEVAESNSVKAEACKEFAPNSKKKLLSQTVTEQIVKPLEVVLEMEASTKLKTQQQQKEPIQEEKKIDLARPSSQKFIGKNPKLITLSYLKILKQLQSAKFREEGEQDLYFQRMKKITHQDSSQIQETLQQPNFQNLSKQDSGIQEPRLVPGLGDQVETQSPIINPTFCQQKTVRQGACITQMVRSASNWSIGVKQKNMELSIQCAYLELISQAKHFIYIENQFFISDTAGNPVKNLVAATIVARIQQAHQNGEKFRIIVFVPLLPGFEGEIDDPAAGVLRVQLHWEYFTISRGGFSILEQLQKSNINPQDYIEFFSLRQHARNRSGTPVTEIIYIHSKLIIIDDEIVLMGSANINDRSLMGSRDSEIAMVVQDTSQVETLMGGEPYQAVQFAHSLRTAIFMEHFDLTYEEVKDPLNDVLTIKMRDQARLNTTIYREVFACYPDDTVTSLEKYKSFKTKKNLDAYETKRELIKGHAVEFPLNFLKNENLKLNILQKEYFCPEINFT